MHPRPRAQIQPLAALELVVGAPDCQGSTCSCQKENFTIQISMQEFFFLSGRRQSQHKSISANHLVTAEQTRSNSPHHSRSCRHLTKIGKRQIFFAGRTAYVDSCSAESKNSFATPRPILLPTSCGHLRTPQERAGNATDRAPTEDASLRDSKYALERISSSCACPSAVKYGPTACTTARHCEKRLSIIMPTNLDTKDNIWQTHPT